jgi:adenylate cyclase
MASDGNPALQRLLEPREAAGVLASFAPLAPELRLALVGRDLRVVARAGGGADDAGVDLPAAARVALHTDGEPRDRVVVAGEFRCHLLSVGARVVGALVVHGPPSAAHVAVEHALHETLTRLATRGLERRELATEALDTYREIGLLCRVGETIGRSLDPDAIALLVLEESCLIKADARLLLLTTGDDGAGELKAALGDAPAVAALREAVRGLVDRLRESGRPAILTDVKGYGGSVLWVPLRTPEQLLGGIALSRGSGQPVFTAKDEKLLVALAAPSASALHNAGLFEVVERQRQEEERLLDVTSAVASELALDGLLAKIISTSSELLGAERSTLFLYDACTDELWSRVAQGLETREIRVPSTAGLAGSCFTSGQAINIRDAYQNPLFNQEVDRKTGYRTNSILCMPVVTKDGRKLGVIEVLNKKVGPFGSHDERILRAFTAQAAIALENVTLFEDVRNERNYNESVLKSLSNGVITLNVDATVAKVNEALLHILKWPESEIIGRPVADLFEHERNRWILASLEKVGRSGDVDITMDADLAIGNGASVSVNTTVVPLVDVKGEAIGRMIVVEDLSREKRVKSAMARYMTKELVDRVLAAEEDGLGGSSHIASVLFSDIRSFTTMAEALGARGTVAMLNEYFTDMVDVVFSHGGILDKYIGDAIMAVFGVPFSSNQDADNAVLVASEMMTALRKLNVQRHARGSADIRIGVGVNTGELIAGNIGSLKRMEYTVVGDTVNLAARLEGATKYYAVDILLSEFTVERLNSEIRCREVDLICVKGKTRPVAVFQSLNHHSAESFPNMGATVAAFEQGRKHYRARQWKRAFSRFREALDHHPADGPSQLYLERCRHYAAHPPGDEWAGAWTMETK